MKRFRFWLGVAISLFFLYFALRGLRLQDLGAVIHEANLLWLIPGIAIYFLGVWVRAWRWHYLLRPMKSVKTRAAFPIVTIGYMGNNIYPARAGEVLRAAVLKRQEGVSITASLATIIVERVFDGVVMLAFVFLNLAELSRLNSDSGFIGSINTLALWGTVAFTGALAALMLMSISPPRTKKLVTAIILRVVPSRFQKKLLKLTKHFFMGLASLRSPREALMIFLASLVIWLLETGKYWFLMQGFPFQVSFFSLMLMNGISNLVTTVPSAPGYIGTFDAAGIAVLMAYGVSKPSAAAYTLVLHIALWGPITALGAYYLARKGIRWSE